MPSPETLTKDWLVRLIAHTELDRLHEVPTERIVREGPHLIDDLLRAILGSEGGRMAPEELEQRARAVVALREGTDAPATDLPRDIAALEAVLLGALKVELEHEPHALADAVERVSWLFSSLQSHVLEDLLMTRSTELEWLAHTDGLTGLFNLRYLQQQVEYLMGLQQRYGHPFALLLLDVDGLKRVNDSFGHAAGDELLVGVAEAIRGATRAVDVAARIGGDEFCVLAAHQTAERAALLGDRLAAAVEALESADGARVGVSIGVVSCPEHSHDPERLFELADGAMYQAKASGERVRLAEPEPAVLENGDGA